MKPVNTLARRLKETVSGKKLFSIFIPALLWGDIFDAQAADTRRVYRPTAAQLRVQQQQREREARIQTIRNQQKNAAGTRTQTVRPEQNAAKTAAAPAKPAQPAPQQVKIRYIWYKGVRFVLVQDIARFYGMAISYTRIGVFLRSRRDTLTLLYDKRLAVVNRVSVYLTHPPILRGALVYLDEKDFLQGIDPLIRNAPLWKHPVKTILLDPGHGGKDQGAPGVGGLLEKNITLSVGHKLALQLRKCGYRVFMTRIGDINLTLQQRVLMCENLKPDLYISIHCNAVKNRRTMGIETYAATPQGAASTSDSKPVLTASAGNSFNRNNYRLAYEVHKNLLAFTQAPDRGVRHARFFVIRNAVCPAILIETGFVTHPKEGLLLNNAAYQAKLVNGIVSGIMAYAKASAIPVRMLPAAQKKAVPPVTKPAAAPAVKPAAKTAPAAKPVSKPTGQTAKPAAKTAPAAKPVSKPTGQTAKPTAKTASAAKPVSKPTGQTAKPAAKTAAPAVKTVSKPTAQSAEPAAKTAAPAVKPTAKTAAPAVKTVTKPTTGKSSQN